MIRHASLVLMVAAMAWSDGVAQQPAAVQPGQRVRVRLATAAAPEVVGVVRVMTSDSLTLEQESGANAGTTTTIPLAGISRLQVSRGRHSTWGKGLLFGAGVGAVAGAIVGLASGNSEGLFNSPSFDAALGVIVFAPTGAVIGTVVGAMTRTERWETVPIPLGAGRSSAAGTAGSPPG